MKNNFIKSFLHKCCFYRDKLLSNKKYVISSIFLIGLLIVLFISNSLAAIVPVESVTIKSTTKKYDVNEPGAWKLTSTATWISKEKINLNLKINSKSKVNYEALDTILVLDNSNSMDENKWLPVKKACQNLIKTNLTNIKNRMALITFNSSANIMENFTNDKDKLLFDLENIDFLNGTNYYQSLTKISEMLTNYQKEDNRELLVIFITDGSPNEGTPNEISEYQSLKKSYPYLTLNTIQYEFRDLTGILKNISNNQYTATVKNINEVLSNAANVNATYSSFIVENFINTDDFIIDEDNFDPGMGTIEYKENKLYWKLINSFKTGEEVETNIRLKLKNSSNVLAPINNSFLITSVVDNINENVKSSLSPIVSNYNTVIYNSNSPSECVVKNMPENEKKHVFDNVIISNKKPICSGYQFKGYEIKTENINKNGMSSFIMPGKDVEIIATWSKLATRKTSIGEVSKAQTLYKVMADNSVIDNIRSEYVTSSSGINYHDISSDTNGKGIYLFAPTKDDEYPIYYYRGDINNNNVKFAGFCWKIVRTTSTGGVKLIYNGEPDSLGYCSNKTGTSTQIGISPYESRYDGAITFGYMHGDLYISILKYLDLFSVLNLTLNEKGNVQNTNYYYSDTVTYENGVYTLVNPTKSIYKENYNKLVLKYTCFSETETSCTTVKQITSRNNYINSFEYYEYKNGETYEQLYEANKSKKWIFGNDVTYTNGTYTLQNTTSIYIPDWISSGRVETDKKYYTCFSENKTCSTVYYLIRRNNSTNQVYYVSLINGKKMDDIKKDSFQNVIDSEIKTYVDNWYKEYMIDYTKYLENTNWCNEREFSDGTLFGKDTSTTWSGFTPHAIAYARLNNANAKPKLTCDYERDRLNTNIAGFNYPTALLTLDEYVLAGGYIKNNTKFYLYNNQRAYTLTPRTYYAFSTANYYITENGNLNGDSVEYNNKIPYGVRPALSLRPGIRTDGGDGTEEKPYVINDVVNKFS
ncbi:MAG: vWA domain-containing protein [Bacilli bacterium]|nr:vWA domain-containing protein [Bacilli bacterium]